MTEVRSSEADASRFRVRAVVVGLVVAVVVQLTPLQQGAWWQESGSAVLLSAALKELRPALPADFGRHLPS